MHTEGIRAANTRRFEKQLRHVKYICSSHSSRRSDELTTTTLRTVCALMHCVSLYPQLEEWHAIDRVFSKRNRFVFYVFSLPLAYKSRSTALCTIGRANSVPFHCLPDDLKSKIAKTWDVLFLSALRLRYDEVVAANVITVAKFRCTSLKSLSLVLIRAAMYFAGYKISPKSRDAFLRIPGCYEENPDGSVRTATPDLIGKLGAIYQINCRSNVATFAHCHRWVFFHPAQLNGNELRVLMRIHATDDISFLLCLDEMYMYLRQKVFRPQLLRESLTPDSKSLLHTSLTTTWAVSRRASSSILP